MWKASTRMEGWVKCMKTLRDMVGWREQVWIEAG
jgi:hypothetical protein